MGKLTTASMRHQSGFVLFMTLVMLVILTISGLAMMQVMNSGVSAAGNIAFRQAAVRVADVAVEDARNWMLGIAADNLTSSAASGVAYYYSKEDKTFNPLTYDWDTKSKHLATKYSGYDLYYVIHRMAMNDGACSAVGTGCVFPPVASSSSTGEGSSHSGNIYGTFIQGAAGLTYYRATVKVSGPRHNVSYVQVLMY
jgi:Tfp pilus assembly protein PilX